jgi:aminoglycoside phosphotransferase
MDHESERPLSGGWVTSGVVQVGQTVRRPSRPNAPFVERLLRHLESTGFHGAPRHLGFDEQGREILTFIEGDVPSDCRDTVWSDEQLSAIGELLRHFHDATNGSEVARGGEVVCHNDFGPWNLVWRAELPVGIIDYDIAAPGARLDDLGYATWKALNLGLVDAPVFEQRRRMTVFASAYGAIADSMLLAAIERAQERVRQVIAEAPAGVGRDDALDQNRRERSWLAANRSHLVT